MTTVTATDLFPHLLELDYAQLVARRAAILGDRTTYTPLTDGQLEELSAVLALLRRKQSGPPREKPEKAKVKSTFSLSNLGID
jgi:hypothetical protein